MEGSSAGGINEDDASDSSKKGADLPQATMSDLPDDVLVSILSHLSMKEAASTSLVSWRWRCLWTWRTQLNFDGWDILSPRWDSEDQENFLRVRFVSFVNQVLRMHNGQTVDEFRIRFMLNNSFAHEIDRWVGFAFAKGVKILELDFASDLTEWVSSFNFLNMFEFLNLYPLDFPGFNNLEALYLKYVDVSQGVVEHFIANCPRLEVLHIEESYFLSALRVSGPSLPLKHLEISNCISLKDLEISAPNLVSFTYCGWKCKYIKLKSAPSLVNLSLRITIGAMDSFLHKCRALHCCFNQLEILEFKALQLHGLRGYGWIPDFPRVKKLIVHISADDSDELLCLLPLLQAAPSLHEFRMMLDWHPTSRRRHRRIHREARYPHQCLKLVEIVGFIGHELDMEFVLAIFDTAVLLEKLILDSRNPVSTRTPSEFVETSKRSIAREHAEFLKGLAPAGIEVLIR